MGSEEVMTLAGLMGSEKDVILATWEVEVGVLNNG